MSDRMEFANGENGAARVGRSYIFKMYFSALKIKIIFFKVQNGKKSS